MKSFDPSGMIVLYNFAIGVLMMLSSERVAVLAGSFGGGRRGSVKRAVYISWFTFGSCAAFLSAMIYICFHVLRIGV